MWHIAASDASRMHEEALERRERQRTERGFCCCCLFCFACSKDEGKIWRVSAVSDIGVHGMKSPKNQQSIMFKNKSTMLLELYPNPSKHFLLKETVSHSLVQSLPFGRFKNWI